jgi:hypothetical protein
MKDENPFDGLQGGIRSDDFDREKVKRLARMNADKTAALNDTVQARDTVNYNRNTNNSLMDQNRAEKEQTPLAQYLDGLKNDPG